MFFPLARSHTNAQFTLTKIYENKDTLIIVFIQSLFLFLNNNS